MTPPSTHSRSASSVPRFLAVVVGLALLVGCKVNGDDIEYWRRTVKGPRRIVAVLLSDHYSIELRTQAATALVEMERNDVEGLALLQRALEELQQQDPSLPPQIVAGMQPRLHELMNDVPPGHPADQSAPPMQIRAKDAAYLLLPHAQGDARTALTNDVVDWYVQDFVGRSLAGNYSVEQVVRSVGAPAASRLVSALNARMPQAAMVKIAELISQLGDADTKRRGGERLVAIEQEIGGDPFLEWLRTNARAQLSSGDNHADPARVEATAVLNREKWMTEGALPAMKFLAGEAAVKTRLMEIASAKPPEGTPGAIAEALHERRRKALQALEGHLDSSDLNTLMVIALDETNPVGVRDDAFDRIGDIRSAEAIPRLWPLVATTTNDDMAKRLRWRAGELILSIGGSSVVEEFLNRLPTTPSDIEYEPEELEGYAQRISQMSDPPTALLVRQLTSSRWWNRIIAMSYLQRRGTQDDVSRLEARRRDQTAIAGDHWSDLELDGATVGAFAKVALRELRERLTTPTPENAAEMSATPPDAPPPTPTTMGG